MFSKALEKGIENNGSIFTVHRLQKSYHSRRKNKKM